MSQLSNKAALRISMGMVLAAAVVTGALLSSPGTDTPVLSPTPTVSVLAPIGVVETEVRFVDEDDGYEDHGYEDHDEHDSYEDDAYEDDDEHEEDDDDD